MVWTQNVFEDIFLAETLLEFLKSTQMVVYARTLDGLTEFKHRPGMPFFFRWILFNLVAGSIVHKTNFLAI